mmetsp:Transcript_23858/g.34891  ORF Transcript_23858/g.34891 Transcript_23858/m.34891 type:complete len:232 (+) Transcript_23858:91-786(+)|eukprot:CAMPEP_0195521148 /NCGR_PEP_ID=MMETSP0794_2-20130614/18099_1 /TAXON_ID=515487 /ORGANISM="Stephanopyxis turris, Strain CCMP 815" /LENGTH=231 /DNA_ID=CAMNT_0040650647 /DNA_START=86 /DNA_END=781 /DNA_ORIENTATION=+
MGLTNKKSMPSCLPTLTLCLILSTYSNFANGSFSIIVPSGGEECFAVKTPGDGMAYISGNFDCLDDHLAPDPVTVVLYDEKKNTVWQSPRSTPEGRFHIASSGRFKLCIGNAVDRAARGDGNARTIGFTIRVREGEQQQEDFEDPVDAIENSDTIKTKELYETSLELADLLETMHDYQSYERSRFDTHRHLTDKTFKRVLRWLLLEAVVVVAVSGGQVMFFRKLFEKKRYF